MLQNLSIFTRPRKYNNFKPIQNLKVVLFRPFKESQWIDFIGGFSLLNLSLYCGGINNDSFKWRPLLDCKNWNFFHPNHICSVRKCVRNRFLWWVFILKLIIIYVYAEPISYSYVGVAMLFSAGTFLYVATVHVLPEVGTKEIMPYLTYWSLLHALCEGSQICVFQSSTGMMLYAFIRSTAAYPHLWNDW